MDSRHRNREVADAKLQIPPLPHLVDLSPDKERIRSGDEEEVVGSLSLEGSLMGRIRLGPGRLERPVDRPATAVRQAASLLRNRRIRVPNITPATQECQVNTRR